MTNDIEIFWPDVSRRINYLFEEHKDQFMITHIDEKRMIIQAKVIIMSDIATNTEYSEGIEPYTLLTTIDIENLKSGYRYIFFHLPIPAHIDALCSFFIHIFSISTYLRRDLMIHNINSAISAYSVTKDISFYKRYSEYYPVLVIHMNVEYDKLGQFIDLLSDYYRYIGNSIREKIEANYIEYLEARLGI